MHTIPYAEIKSQLHAANYGNPKPLEDYIVTWMLDTLGKILSHIVIQIDQGAQQSFPLEVRFPQLEPRVEHVRHRVVGGKIKHLMLHPREWSRQ